MKEMIDFLIEEVRGDRTHAMKKVTTEAVNCYNIFENYINDGEKKEDFKDRLLGNINRINRQIIDDLAVWSSSNGKEYHFGINTLRGEDMKCITFDTRPELVTDYGMGIAFKTEDGKLLAYAHRTEKGCKLIDLREVVLDDDYHPIGIVLDDRVEFNKYVVAFRNNVIEKSDKYITCTFKDNKMYIIDNVNEMIYNYEGTDDIYNIKPFTYDLFVYQRGNDGKNVIFSKYYNKALNVFSSDFDILRIMCNYPDTYDSNGVVILYRAYYDNKSSIDIVVGGDVHIGSLVATKEEDYGKTVILAKELTYIFKTVHGTDMFYSVIPKEDDEEKHTFLFFKMINGKLEPAKVEASSIPGEIYIDKDSHCITLEYNTNGYHQVAYFWEDEMELYKYSHIDIRLERGVDAEIVLTKFKEHIDSLNVSEEMGTDEYYNLHHFRNMTKGLIVDGQQMMESNQFANITRNEIYPDIRKIYMSYNGKIQFRQRFDNTIEEYISVDMGNTEERFRLIEEMYEDTIREANRLTKEMNNESQQDKSQENKD